MNATTSTYEPTMVDFWHLIARATSGHSDYDRATRDNRFDAARAAQCGDDFGRRYWSARAMVCFLLRERGYGYNSTVAQFDECAVDGFAMFGLDPDGRELTFEVVE